MVVRSPHVKPAGTTDGGIRSMSMKILLGAVAALTLSACSGPEPAAAPPADASAAEPTPAVAPASLDLSGSWTVAEIIGAPPDPGTPVVEVTITADQIRAQSQCKHYWWTYTLAGETFDATKAPYPDAVCERTDTPWEEYFVSAIERANQIVHEPDGDVLFTGPGGQALLRRKG